MRSETVEKPGTVMIYEKEKNVRLNMLTPRMIETPILDAIRGARAQSPDEWTGGRIIPE